MEPKEDVFDDLPQEEGAADPADEGQEPKIEPEDKSTEEVQKLQRDLEHARTMIKEKDKVAREERERRKKESDERRRLEAELKKRDTASVDEDEDGDEEAPSTQIAQQIDPKDIARQAKQELRADMYNDEVIKVIKSRPGITRQEAKEVLEIVNKLPKSGDASLDADFAFDYRAKMQNRDRSFTPPTPTGGGGVTRASAAPGAVTAGAIELGKAFGVSKADFEKFGGDLKI